MSGMTVLKQRKRVLSLYPEAKPASLSHAGAASSGSAAHARSSGAGHDSSTPHRARESYLSGGSVRSMRSLPQATSAQLAQLARESSAALASSATAAAAATSAQPQSNPASAGQSTASGLADAKVGDILVAAHTFQKHPEAKAGDLFFNKGEAVDCLVAGYFPFVLLWT